MTSLSNRASRIDSIKEQLCQVKKVHDKAVYIVLELQNSFRGGDGPTEKDFNLACALFLGRIRCRLSQRLFEEMDRIVSDSERVG